MSEIYGGSGARPRRIWARGRVDGSDPRIRHILQERGSRIRIESSPEVSVEVDGELLGESPLEFSILHRAVRIVVGAGFAGGAEAGK